MLFKNIDSCCNHAVRLERTTQTREDQIGGYSTLGGKMDILEQEIKYLLTDIINIHFRGTAFNVGQTIFLTAKGSGFYTVLSCSLAMPSLYKMGKGENSVFLWERALAASPGKDWDNGLQSPGTCAVEEL